MTNLINVPTLKTKSFVKWSKKGNKNLKPINIFDQSKKITKISLFSFFLIYCLSFYLDKLVFCLIAFLKKILKLKFFKVPLIRNNISKIS